MKSLSRTLAALTLVFATATAAARADNQTAPADDVAVFTHGLMDHDLPGTGLVGIYGHVTCKSDKAESIHLNAVRDDFYLESYGAIGSIGIILGTPEENYTAETTPYRSYDIYYSETGIKPLIIEPDFDKHNDALKNGTSDMMRDKEPGFEEAKAAARDTCKLMM